MIDLVKPKAHPVSMHAGSGTRDDSRLLEVLNALNASISLAQPCWQDNHVVLSYIQFAESLTAVEFVTTVKLFAVLADELDTLIAQQVGGNLVRAEERSFRCLN